MIKPIRYKVISIDTHESAESTLVRLNFERDVPVSPPDYISIHLADSPEGCEIGDTFELTKVSAP